MKSKQLILAGLSVCTSWLLISCEAFVSLVLQAPQPENNPTASTSEKIAVENNFTERIIFQQPDGNRAFSLRPRQNGIKLEGSQGQTIVHLVVDFQGKVQIKTAAGSILGHILRQKDRWQIQDGEETRILYSLSQQNDGGYILKSSEDLVIYQIKQHDNGWKIETPEAETIYTVKMQNDRSILQDGAQNIVLKTDPDFSLLALACYGFNVLDRTQQTALAYAIHLGDKVD